MRARTLARELGLEGRLSQRGLGSITHVLTHRALSVDVFGLRAAEGREHASLRKLGEPALKEVGVAKLTLKILAAAALAVPTSRL